MVAVVRVALVVPSLVTVSGLVFDIGTEVLAPEACVSPAPALWNGSSSRPVIVLIIYK